ncbi:MAG TPA: FAD-dependent oxidoreductase [Gemmatimonadales bacterium]|nr:FAD-dependent oxidoreductase [Gemmatimonadales bacterium]
MARFDYLIVGGGMTADAAARGIRKEDGSGTIAVVGAEAHAPYSRPPLTKALWKGDPLESIWRKTEDTGAELIGGRRIVQLDPGGKRATDDRGAVYEYGTLLLATGGRPRRLREAPDDVIYFRTFDDYRRVRERADQGASFVVVGGGFIGSELAAALRMQGREVTLLMKEEGIGARVYPADLSRRLVEYYREKGVEVRHGRTVNRVEWRDGKLQVSGGQDEPVRADVVVAGLGIEPNVDLARDIGLEVGDGIVVDEYLRTGREGVYAAGDVASFHNRALDMRMRVEHEDNANTMGEIAGRNMAGARRRYEHLPFFYSDLFDLGYEAVGDVSVRHQMVADWKEEFREGVIYYLSGGRVRGVLLWNTWGQVDAARALIAEPGPFRPEQLRGRLPAEG